MDIDNTANIEKTGENKSQPVKEEAVWDWIRLLFVFSLIGSSVCIAISIATDYGDVPIKLSLAGITSTAILFSVLVCHTFSMAEKERESLGQKKKKSRYSYLGM